MRAINQRGTWLDGSELDKNEYEVGQPLQPAVRIPLSHSLTVFIERAAVANRAGHLCMTDCIRRQNNIRG